MYGLRLPVINVLLCGLGIVGPSFGAEPGKAFPDTGRYRGIAVFSSSIGSEVSVEEILAFVRTSRLSLVVIDFAWVTHHWPRTSLQEVARCARLLDAAGVSVAAMYRPRLLRPTEASVHCAVDDGGKTAADHNELCFAQEDSRKWAALWGTRLLRACPAISTIVLYNLRAACRCPQCRDGRPGQYITEFLGQCRSEWQKVRSGVRIGHVGAADEYASKVDFLCPFLPVQRTGERSVDGEALVREVDRLRSRVAPIPVVPLVKTCWAEATNNQTGDVISLIRACDASGLSYVLWYYEWLFHPTEHPYDNRALLSALGGKWNVMSAYLGEQSGKNGHRPPENPPGNGTNTGVLLKGPQPSIADSGAAESQMAPQLAPPPTPLPTAEKLPWPHQPPGLSRSEIEKLSREVWVINNYPLYQADKEGMQPCIHGGLDIVVDNGTRIYAIKDGWVKAVVHSSVYVADRQDERPSFGWEYTHLSDIRVEAGDRVKRGTLIGKVNFQGLPHIHLVKVFSQGGHWGSWHYMCPPDLHFTCVDTDSPVIKRPFLFYRNDTDERIVPDEAGDVVLEGDIDIVVGMRDGGQFARSKENGFGDRLAVAAIDYEIRSLDRTEGRSRRHHSFDFRILTILSGCDASEFNAGMTRVVYKHTALCDPMQRGGDKAFSYYVITNCPPEGPPRELYPSDRHFCWKTAAVDRGGKRLYPAGRYAIVVTARDFAGNESTAEMSVRVAQGAKGRPVRR